MAILFRPFLPFVQHPERSALVAALFLAGWLLTRRLELLVDGGTLAFTRP